MLVPNEVTHYAYASLNLMHHDVDLTAVSPPFNSTMAKISLPFQRIAQSEILPSLLTALLTQLRFNTSKIFVRPVKSM